MQKQHYIYLLIHPTSFWFKSREIIKIGSTTNIRYRFLGYFTAHPLPYDYYCYYEIKNYDCYQLDEDIKKSNILERALNIDNIGGKEFYFYIPNITDILENYFIQRNIIFERFDPPFKFKYDKINYETIKKEAELLSELLTIHNKYQNKSYDLSIISDEQIKEVISSYNSVVEYYDNMNKIKKPFDWQEEIINKTIIHFTQNNKGKLILACGSGKTLISYWCVTIAKYNKILILVPSLYLLGQFSSVWMQQMKDELINYPILIIGSDKTIKNSTTDPTTIDNFVKKYIDKYIIFCTYQSSNLLQNIKFDICVYDEAHRLAGKGINDEDTYFRSLLRSNNITNKLFMTATEKQITIKNDEAENIFSMDDEIIFGKLIDNLNTREAINMKILSDYKIIVPSISHKDIIKYRLSIDDIEYIMYAHILVNAIIEYNLTHIITYHNKVDNANKFKLILQEITKKYYKILQPNIQSIDGTMTNFEKNNIINDFVRNKLSIVTSAKVLNEGIDIKQCDAVMFCDDRRSIIDIVQSTCRCLRKCENKEMAFILIPVITNKDNIVENDEFRNIRIMLRTLASEDNMIKHYFHDLERLEGNIEKMGNKLIEWNCMMPVDNFNNIVNKVREDMGKFAYLPFEEAKDFLHSFKFTCKSEYYEYMQSNKRRFDLPLSPSTIYKDMGYVDIWDYLGITKSNISLAEIKNKIKYENIRRKLTGENIIETRDDYYEFSKTKKVPDDIEDRFEKNLDWNYLFDNDNKQYYNYNEAIEIIKEFKQKHPDIDDSTIFYDMCRKEYNKLPPEPSQCYNGDFTSMRSFVGMNSKKHKN